MVDVPTCAMGSSGKGTPAGLCGGDPEMIADVAGTASVAGGGGGKVCGLDQERACGVDASKERGVAMGINNKAELVPTGGNLARAVRAETAERSAERKRDVGGSPWR